MTRIQKKKRTFPNFSHIVPNKQPTTISYIPRIIRFQTVRKISFVEQRKAFSLERRQLDEERERERDFFYIWGRTNPPGLALVDRPSRAIGLLFSCWLTVCCILPRAGKLPGTRLVSNRGHWPRYVGYTGRPWASWPICEVPFPPDGPLPPAY